jgi:hypothetical protein
MSWVVSWSYVGLLMGWCSAVTGPGCFHMYTSVLFLVLPCPPTDWFSQTKAEEQWRELRIQVFGGHSSEPEPGYFPMLYWYSPDHAMLMISTSTLALLLPLPCNHFSFCVSYVTSTCQNSSPSTALLLLCYVASLFPSPFLHRHLLPLRLLPLP